MFATWFHIFLGVAYVFGVLVTAGVWKGLFKPKELPRDADWYERNQHSEAVVFYYFVGFVAVILWPVAVPFLLVCWLLGFLFFSSKNSLYNQCKGFIDRVAEKVGKLK